MTEAGAERSIGIDAESGRRGATMNSTTEMMETIAETSSLELGDLKRMTIDQYEEMARLGVLDDPRVELINGFLVRKMTKRPLHSSTVGVLAELLRDITPDGWHLRIEQPIRLPNYDEPEPDLAVTRGKPGDYRQQHPSAEDVALVIEISESSLRVDRGDKLRAYARGGIAQYWIVNLVDRRIEAHGSPGPDGYGSTMLHDPSSRVAVRVEGAEAGTIAVAEALPERDAEEADHAR